ncbi:MAG: hypothetical protein V8S39_01980 [Lachnospiraceae bacterium]|jgi:hydrogenase-4 membrane subunit HyfE
MKTFFIVLGIIVIVLAILLVVLYFLGKNLQKKQASQQEAMDAAAQQMNLYIIDMKMMKAMDANLPKMVTEQIPKYMRRAKLPIVKAKVGPRVMSLICDAKVFDTIAPKQEVKATVSGLYITAAKRIRGPIVETDPKKRKEQRKQEKKEAKKAAREAKKNQK